MLAAGKTQVSNVSSSDTTFSVLSGVTGFVGSICSTIFGSLYNKYMRDIESSKMEGAVQSSEIASRSERSYADITAEGEREASSIMKKTAKDIKNESGDRNDRKVKLAETKSEHARLAALVVASRQRRGYKLS